MFRKDTEMMEVLVNIKISLIRQNLECTGEWSKLIKMWEKSRMRKVIQ
jgi:hypothetical protein